MSTVTIAVLLQTPLLLKGFQQHESNIRQCAYTRLKSRYVSKLNCLTRLPGGIQRKLEQALCTPMSAFTLTIQISKTKAQRRPWVPATVNKAPGAIALSLSPRPYDVRGVHNASLSPRALLGDWRRASQGLLVWASNTTSCLQAQILRTYLQLVERWVAQR